MSPIPYDVLGSRSHTVSGVDFLAKASSSDISIQYVLSDVPFYTVGVFAVGVLAFFLVLRKCNRWVICLHSAVFMGFAAGILDLVQVLFRQGKLVNNNINQNPILGIIITREIAYAVSFGLRYLWLWNFAGCAPPGVRYAEEEKHSGLWGRWGICGHILRWTLLACIFAITTLQMLYRIYTPLQTYGPLYAAEAALQIVVSATFTLKLGMNVYLAALDSVEKVSRLHLLLKYSPIIVALSVSILIGVGNIIQYLFSESILGRLLQAVELYIIILYVLIVAFYHLRNVSDKPTTRHRVNRSSSFHALGPPRISATDLFSGFQQQVPQRELISGVEKVEQSYLPNMLNDNSRSTYALRLSSWFVSRRPSRRATRPPSPKFERVSRLYQTQMGQAPSPVEVDIKFPPTSAEPTPVESTEGLLEKKQSSNAVRSFGPERTVKPLFIKPPAITAPPVARLRSSVIFEPDTAPTMSTLLERPTESPIYGLSGIINRNGPAFERNSEIDDDPRKVFENPSPHSSGISGLLRQQEELDKSIAALKLFSSPNDETVQDDSEAEAEGPRAASPKSVFSLSNFPEPPWGRTSVDTTIPRDSNETIRPPLPAPQEQLQTPGPSSSGSLSELAAQRTRKQSVPSSEIGEVIATGRNRLDSAGTQFEITSFIGHLTHPGHKQAGSGASGASGASALPQVAEGAVSSTNPNRVSVALRPLLLQQRAGPRVTIDTSSGPPPRSSLRASFVMQTTLPSRSRIDGRRPTVPSLLAGKRPVGLPARPSPKPPSATSPSQRAVPAGIPPTPF